MSDQKPTIQTIPASDLCSLTGLTDRRHRQLAQEGWFPNPLKGEYQTTKTIAGLFRYYRERATASDQLKAEKIRLTKADADLKEMQKAREEGSTIDAEEVHRVINAALLPCRQQFLSLPATMAARCNPSDPTLAEEALKQFSERAMRTIQEQVRATSK